MACDPANTQISLGIPPVWSESSLCAQCVAKDPSFPHADSEDADQTGRMPGLIWIFTGRMCHFVGFVTRQLNFMMSQYLVWVFLWHIWQANEEPSASDMSGFDSSDEEGEVDLSPFQVSW